MAAGVWVAGLYHPREGEQTIKKLDPRYVPVPSGRRDVKRG
ncbi:hypothetical protein [Paraburkholderia sp. CI3]